MGQVQAKGEIARACPCLSRRDRRYGGAAHTTPRPMVTVPPCLAQHTFSHPFISLLSYISVQGSRARPLGTGLPPQLCPRSGPLHAATHIYKDKMLPHLRSHSSTSFLSVLILLSIIGAAAFVPPPSILSSTSRSGSPVVVLKSWVDTRVEIDVPASPHACYELYSQLEEHPRWSPWYVFFLVWGFWA